MTNQAANSEFDSFDDSLENIVLDAGTLSNFSQQTNQAEIQAILDQFKAQTAAYIVARREFMTRINALIRPGVKRDDLLLDAHQEVYDAERRST